MNSYNVYPFFIECSKHYERDSLKYSTLVDLAVGKRGIFIKRGEKEVNTYIVTRSGEFEIPKTYSTEKQLEFQHKWWGYNDGFTQMRETIKESRKNWNTTKKKDKIYLFHKYISSLNIDISYKILFSSLLTFALLLKVFKLSDISYDQFEIKKVNEHFFKKDTYRNIKFLYDYSIPLSSKQLASCCTTTVD